jgi:ATP-dependent DNA helicase RecG
VIAEVDLQLRGPGDMLGTRQAGMPEFRYVDLARDAALVAAARDEAFALVERDPHIRASELAELRRYVLGHAQSFPHIAIA